MEEIWKDIEGYEGLYQVSNLGRVRSLYYQTAPRSKPRVLNGFKTNNRIYVDLYKEGTASKHQVSRLVALSFVHNPDPSRYDVVNHINHNSLNNLPENLEWCNTRENSSHGKTVIGKLMGARPNPNGRPAKKWNAYIRIDNKRRYLGGFPTEQEAHQAYINALDKFGLVNKYAKTA